MKYCFLGPYPQTGASDIVGLGKTQAARRFQLPVYPG